MIDFVDAIRSNSSRFSECIRTGDLDASVPSCPNWTLADLAWHLTGVQAYWGSIAVDLLLDPSAVGKPPRPRDDELPELFEAMSIRLAEALERHPAEARCWTWDENGWSIGWVRRRQAHEALIHRVDAELAVGHRTPIDGDLAADGIDELLRVMIDGIPEWATFIPDETFATLSLDDGPAYGLRFGRIVGAGPDSDQDYDFDSFLLAEPRGTVISGPAVALDLWLWGRDTGGVRCEDQELLKRIRAIVTEATQ